MPVKEVEKNGKKYYKWGRSGKMYRSKIKADKQAKAIYSSGYKEKE